MIRRILLGSVGLATLVHGTAWACSCVGGGGGIPPDMVDEFDLVIWGEVLSVGQPLPGCLSGSSAEPVHVRIRALDAFAGADPNEIVTVLTPESGASCGVLFEPGTTWLIVAEEDRQVFLCGPSEAADADDPGVVALREAGE